VTPLERASSSRGRAGGHRSARPGRIRARRTSRIRSRVVLASGLLAVPLLGLTACGDDESLAPPPSTRQQCLDQATFTEPASSPYCLPYAVGSAYALGQSYCSPPPGSHQTRFALDFVMPEGTEILAARAGEVVELREHWPSDNRTGGHENMVSLRHEDETISLYLHLQQDGVAVEMGDVVQRGELLGWSGSSGDPAGVPHLHFQVCLRSGMCSWQTGEYTLPVNFRNAEGSHDPAGGLMTGRTYRALPCG
jgi:hypothetical protein